MSEGELQRFVAFAFQATGRRRLLEEDIVRLVAHERRWLPPSKVRLLVQSARAQGLLKAAGAHAFELGHELEHIRIAFDYHPDLGMLEQALSSSPAPSAPVSVFRRILRAIREQTQESEPQIVAKVNELQQETGGLLRAEAAALVVAGRTGIDVTEFAREVADEIQRKSSPGGAR